MLLKRSNKCFPRTLKRVKRKRDKTYDQAEKIKTLQSGWDIPNVKKGYFLSGQLRKMQFGKRRK